MNINKRITFKLKKVTIYNFTLNCFVVCKIIRTFASEIKKMRYDYREL